ncbi:MAG: hypothetical protein C4343_01890 [Chloroflexota bacterium]
MSSDPPSRSLQGHALPPCPGHHRAPAAATQRRRRTATLDDRPDLAVAPQPLAPARRSTVRLRSRRQASPDQARSTTTSRRAPLAVLLTLAVAACASPPSTPSSSATASSGASPSAPRITEPTTKSPTARPPGSPPSARPTPTDSASCPAEVLARLTEAQRIGQLFAVGLPGNELGPAARTAIVSYHIGSWWFTQTTTLGAAAVRAVSRSVQAQVSGPSTGGVGFFVAANQEGGQIQALRGTGFDRIPSALEQGAWAPATLRARAERWGRQLLAAGVNLDFAPVADVVPPGGASENAPIGALDREFGFEPVAVADHVAAFVEGMAAAGVATTVKHFPGLGRVTDNTDVAADVVDTVTTVDDPDLEPFRRGAEVGASAVMVALATYEAIDPGTIAAFSPSIVGGLLRDDLGFGGLILSDSLSAEAVAMIAPGDRALRFLDAGGDLIVVGPVDIAVEMARAIAARARTNPAFRDRINDAALRVLRAKAAAGLLACGN